MSDAMLITVKLLLTVAVAVVIYFVSHRSIISLGNRQILSGQAVALLTGIIKWVLIITVTLVGLNIFGISVTALWASLSAMFMLIAIGFVAVWSVLSNASCALFLVLFSPFRIGDEIEVLEPSALDPAKPGLRGRVKDISFLYTTLEQSDEGGGIALVRVPNNIFFQRAVRCRQGDNTKSLKQALFETPQTSEITGEKEKAES